MKIALLVCFALTFLAAAAAVVSSGRVRHAEDNYAVSLWILVAAVLGIADVVLMVAILVTQ